MYKHLYNLNMQFYQDLGFLILGSRLRRLSEYYLAEVNKVYNEKDIPFDASWFPVFYVLAREKTISLKAIAAELMVSHSAVSQLIKSLKAKGLVSTIPSKTDKRHQMVTLSKRGSDMLAQLKPVWEEITGSFACICAAEKEAASLLPALLALENYFKEKSLSETILKDTQ